jgi:hypothetical protein
MNSTNYRDAAELEREGDQRRASIDQTLNDIERELSPSKLLDRSMEYFRDHGGDFVREAGETVRNNPLPILLTAAGVVWLTAAIASSRDSSRGRRKWNGDGGHIDTDMSSFDDFAEGHGYSSRNDGDSGQRYSSDSYVSQAESAFTRLVRDQPVALGAIALAAGALLGAALPMTSYENRLMNSVASGNRSKPGNGGSSTQSGQNDNTGRGSSDNSTMGGSSTNSSTTIGE